MSTPCPTESEIRAFITSAEDGPGQDSLVEHFLDCAACQAVMDRVAPWGDQAAPATPATPEGGLAREVAREILQGVRGALQSSDRLAGGRFQIVRLLGAGGMGEVFEAVDTRLNRRVAIKTIRGDFFSPDALQRLEAEAKALAELTHPGIVRVHEWGSHRSLPFLAMEFVDGETLSARLKRGALAPADAARLARQVALALDHVHQSGLLHRDIKPSNIVLQPAGEGVTDSLQGQTWRPRLIDFGLTKRLEGAADLSRAGSLLGTPAYMPPEQVENRPELVGPRSDLYALGAVLYHCLTGQPPFPSDSEANTLQMVRLVDPPNPRLFNRAIPRDLETICLKCLRKEPAGRYATAADLAADLGRFLDGRPIVARPAGRVERLWRWARRNRRLAAALSALALALLVLVGVLGVYGLREARLHRLAEEEAARANALLEETVRVYARSANELALAASSLALTGGNFREPRILMRYQKLQAAYSRMLEDFAGSSRLADSFPETLAEMYYFQARMCEDVGDRAGAAASDRRMLEVLARVENPRDESLERELAVAAGLGGEAALAKRPTEAAELLRAVWNRRHRLPADRFQPGSSQWLLMQNIAMILSDVLVTKQKDPQAAETVQRQLAELREKVEAQAKGPK